MLICSLDKDSPSVTPENDLFYLKAEQEKMETLYFFSMSGFSAPCDSDRGCNRKLLWKVTLKILLSSQEAKLFPEIREIATLQGITAENGGGTVRAQSRSSKISHRKSSSFHKNSSSKLFFSPFNFSDPFSESISYDPAKAVIKTRPSVAEIPGLKRNI